MARAAKLPGASLAAQIPINTMQDAQQTSFPAVDPFDITQRLFALSATLPDQHNPTVSDAIKAIEDLPGVNLLGLNNLPLQPDFESSISGLLGPRHHGAPITDPALERIRRGLMRLLATSRYRRGIDGGIWRESFLVAPMVVFLGQNFSHELRFDAANFAGALPPAGQVMGFFRKTYGGEFFQASPLLAPWVDYASGDNSDDPESYIAMPFSVRRAVADSILEHGVLALDPEDQASEYLDSQELFGFSREMEFCGPRAYVMGLPLIHAAPVGRHFSMLSDEDVPLEFQCLSDEMKADAPLSIGKDSNIILLKPQPLDLAKVSIEAVARWLHSMQTELFPARLCRAYAGYRARIDTDPPALACRITSSSQFDGHLSAFSGTPDALALVDELFERLCAAFHVEIRDVEVETTRRASKA